MVKRRKVDLDNCDMESEASIRAKLINGLLNGVIEKDDIPALLEFYRGNDELGFDKWELFKKQLNEETLSVVADRTKQMEELVRREREKLKELEAIHDELREKQLALLGEIDEALSVLDPCEHGHEGNSSDICFSHAPNNIIEIWDGYDRLIEAIEKYKTSKGVFVVCDGKVHKITCGYFEEKGRAFLLGSTKELRTNKPERIKEIVDELWNSAFNMSKSQNV